LVAATQCERKRAFLVTFSRAGEKVTRSPRRGTRFISRFLKAWVKHCLKKKSGVVAYFNLQQLLHDSSDLPHQTQAFDAEETTCGAFFQS
jgi:hypothetical protein